jgi:hypothetical protein
MLNNNYNGQYYNSLFVVMAQYIELSSVELIVSLLCWLGSALDL